jgi:16S rRNA processing protein RimM
VPTGIDEGDAGLLEVGRITKAHGLRGEVVVDMVSERPERVAPGAVLRAGDRVLTVASSRPHQGKWLVTFAGVGDRTAAEALHGARLRAAPLDDPDELWVHDLIGSRCVELGGTDRGTVVAVVDNPAHDLLELASGALVPVTFVVSCAHGITTIDPPAGLFDSDLFG